MENSIEEITFVENKIKNTRRAFEEVGCHVFFDEDLCKAIEHILSDYKRVLKENNRLEEQVEYDKTHIYTPQTIKLNFISKSKIKDKIEQLKEKEESDLKCYGFAVDTHLALQTLQELLDGSDTDVGGIGSEN